MLSARNVSLIQFRHARREYRATHLARYWEAVWWATPVNDGRYTKHETSAKLARAILARSKGQLVIPKLPA